MVTRRMAAVFFYTAWLMLVWSDKLNGPSIGSHKDWFAAIWQLAYGSWFVYGLWKGIQWCWKFAIILATVFVLFIIYLPIAPPPNTPGFTLFNDMMIGCFALSLVFLLIPSTRESLKSTDGVTSGVG